MLLTRSLSILAFVLAFTIGALPAFLMSPSVQPEAVPPVPIFEPAPVSTTKMKGTWTGRWDKDQAHCTIEIDRIEGDKFYGTLTKRGAIVTFTGTLDPATRTVLIQETKVLDHGDHPRWSLGTNTGAFSLDGRTMTGAGRDEFGTYFWEVTKN